MRKGSTRDSHLYIAQGGNRYKESLVRYENGVAQKGMMPCRAGIIESDWGYILFESGKYWPAKAQKKKKKKGEKIIMPYMPSLIVPGYYLDAVGSSMREWWSCAESSSLL